MKTTIIGLSGRKGAGKGTLAKFITANANFMFPRKGGATSAVCPMAGPIKRLCVSVLGLTHAQVYGSNEEKNSLTRYRWEDMPHYRHVVVKTLEAAQRKGYLEHDLGYEAERIINFGYDDRQGTALTVFLEHNLPRGLMTSRQVQQEIGTAIFRKMHDNIWAEACLRDIHERAPDVAIVDDVRFPNEVEAILDAGGAVLRLTRNPHPGDTHASEVALDPDRYDWENFSDVIDNANMDERAQAFALWDSLSSMGIIPALLELDDEAEASVWWPEAQGSAAGVVA